MNKNSIFTIITFLFLSTTTLAQQDDYSVFKSSSGRNPIWIAYRNNNTQLYKTITTEAFKLIDKRAEKISELKSVTDWQDYQKDLFEKFFVSMNNFKKTPLNAKITGTIEKENFTVEKILFESHPNFFVTGCLYIPKKHEKPAATVIYVSGHSSNAFRSPTYQNIILNLVDKGFIVFAIDPIGQGERLQYVNSETNASDIGGPTTEHSYAGVQTLLTGISLSSYFIWDGVRAIDYLATRKEVDMKRLGITGRSGGGTQSALIAAYDSRIFASAPECYITNFKRLLQSIGPQDAEQNPYNAIKLGFDFADYFHLRAPKPSLIITTTNGFFSQQGARETFAEVQKSYTAFGFPDNIQEVEDLGIHESTKKNREAMYAFFQKYLNNPGDNSDSTMTVFPEEELWVTETGQVGTSLKGETVFSLNEKYFKKKEVPQNKLQETIKNISGINLDYKLTASVYTGKIPGDTFEIKKYFLENNKDEFALPVWVVKTPETEPDKILVWLNPEGKTEILKSPLLQKFINSGYTIISADLPETGELKNLNFKGDGFVKNVPFNYTFGANLVGKSVTGIRADALDLLMQFVAKQNTGHAKIDAFIERDISAAFLHYTAFNNPFSKVVFLNPFVSNESLIHEKYYSPKLAFNVVPGSVGYYDFKELISFLPKNSVKIINPANVLNEPESVEIDEPEILEFLINK
jgi:cephalosporin-C deacetylase-like acetyl esterase